MIKPLLLIPKDYYDTQRNMEACEGQNKVPFLLETSAFASFKDLPLPDEQEALRGLSARRITAEVWCLCLTMRMMLGA